MISMNGGTERFAGTARKPEISYGYLAIMKFSRNEESKHSGTDMSR